MIKIYADMAAGINGSNTAFNSQLYPQKLCIIFVGKVYGLIVEYE